MDFWKIIGILRNLQMILLTLLSMVHSFPFGLKEDSDETTIIRPKNEVPFDKFKPNDISKEFRGRDCCENGGTCYLGSFCICPPFSFGRHCEHVKSGCGPLNHGDIIREGCDICACIDGVISCIPRVFEGCRKKSEEIDVQIYNLTATNEKEKIRSEKMLSRLLLSGGESVVCSSRFYWTMTFVAVYWLAVNFLR